MRYGYNTFDDNVDTISAGFDPAQLGFAQSFTRDIAFNKFPAVKRERRLRPVAGRARFRRAERAAVVFAQFSDGVSKLLGRHSLKAGFDYRKLCSSSTTSDRRAAASPFTAVSRRRAEPNAAPPPGATSWPAAARAVAAAARN